MIDDPNDLLVEQAASAFRERGALGRILPSPAWMDLSPLGRALAYERQLESRLIERAAAPDGLSATARAVLERLSRV